MLFCRSAVKHRTSSTTVGSPLFVPNVRRSHISLQESLCDFPIDPSRSFDGFAIRHPLRRSPHTHLSNYNIGWDPVLHRRAPTPCTDSVPDLPDFYQEKHRNQKTNPIFLHGILFYRAFGFSEVLPGLGRGSSYFLDQDCFCVLDRHPIAAR